MCILKHDKDMAITQWPKMPSLMDVWWSMAHQSVYIHTTELPFHVKSLSSTHGFLMCGHDYAKKIKLTNALKNQNMLLI